MTNIQLNTVLIMFFRSINSFLNNCLISNSNYTLQKMRIISIIVILFIWCFFTCSSERSPSELNNIVARIDREIITLDEFRTFYELDPNFGIDSAGYGVLMDELNKMIDHTLAYKKATLTGLIRDSLFIKARDWELRNAMIRHLYREKIDKQITVDEQQLREAFLKYNTKLRVRHLFTEERDQASELYSKLQKGHTFEELASQVFTDSILANNGGEIGWITMGELDDQFAEAAYKLKQNDISQPVETQWGFHIIQLLDKEDPLIITESSFYSQKRSIEKKLRQKQRRTLSNEYITLFMKDINPQPVTKNFRLLWSAIIPLHEQERANLKFKMMFSNELIHKAIYNLQNQLNRPLIKYNEGSISIREYLTALKKIPISNRPRFLTALEFSNQIGIWIRDELLYQEALNAKLDDHPTVLKEIEQFVKEQSYYYFLQKEIEEFKIPEAVNEYFKSKDKAILKTYPDLRIYHTKEEWHWAQGEKTLHQSLKNINVHIEIDSSLIRNESKNIDWDRRIRMIVVRKPS